MDHELDKFIKNWNIKYNLKEVLNLLEFENHNDTYYTKDIENKNVHVKFEEDEFVIWCSDNVSKKYTKYYSSLRCEKERGFYNEESYIKNILELILKGGN